MHLYRPGLRGPHAILVPRARHDELVELAAAMRPGTRRRSHDPESMGPLVAERQRDRVEGYIARATGGATLVTGGGRPAELNQRLVRGADPVRRRRNDVRHRPGGDLRSGAAASSPTRTRTTPIRIANDSNYGLTGAVWTGDRPEALTWPAACAPGGPIAHLSSLRPCPSADEAVGRRTRAGTRGAHGLLEPRSIGMPPSLLTGPAGDPAGGRGSAHLVEPHPRGLRGIRAIRAREQGGNPCPRSSSWSSPGSPRISTWR